MKLTLDTNCLIDLESHQGSYDDLQLLVAMHETGSITLCVPGITASEQLRAGGYLPSFKGFAQRIEQLTKRPIEVLRPIGHWNVTYWDEGLWADDEMIQLEQTIHAMLFPAQPYEWSMCARQNRIDPTTIPREENVPWRKWRNRLCDCAVIWCHIYHRGDALITRDNNFLKSKRACLESLGAKCIIHPRDIKAYVRTNPARDST